MPNAIPVNEWLEFIDSEYLSTFIKAGGASVKFIVPPEELKSDLYESVWARCQELDYLCVDLDAADMRAYMPQDIFFGMASQIDWRALAYRFMLGLAQENGYRVDGLSHNDAGDVFENIANANGIEPQTARILLLPSLQNKVLRNPRMARDFRVAMIQLCSNSGSLASERIEWSHPIVEWLTGRNTRLGNVRPYSIYTPINRNTARHFIESALYWVQRAGYSGTVVLLDNSRAMLRHRPKPPDDKRYYTKAMVVEHYELLREFIDSVERLQGMLLLTITNQDFLDDSSDRNSRGYGIYQALRTRIMDDVRDRNLVNPAGSLVRLSQIETEKVKGINLCTDGYGPAQLQTEKKETEDAADEDLDLPW